MNNPKETIMTDEYKPLTTKDMLEEAVDIIKGLLDRAPLSATRARDFLRIMREQDKINKKEAK